MATFRRTTKLTGEIKDLVATENQFVDANTGEVVNVAEVFHGVFGGQPFSIVATYAENEKFESPEEAD